LEFGDGFTAFVGSNNSGKSASLKAIYELRNIFPYFFNTLQPNNGFKVNCQPNGVSDRVELANDNDPTKFQITLELKSEYKPGNNINWQAFEICLEYDVESQNLCVKKL